MSTAPYRAAFWRPDTVPGYLQLTDRSHAHLDDKGLLAAARRTAEELDFNLDNGFLYVHLCVPEIPGH